jgi:hypothetical protein
MVPVPGNDTVDASDFGWQAIISKPILLAGSKLRE